MPGTPRPIVKIAVNKNNYQALSALATAVSAALLANVGFYDAPNPTLANLNGDIGTLDAAIAAWGPVGARGSHADLIALRLAAQNLYNDLKQEAGYVQNKCYAAGGTYADIKNNIVLSGFGVKNASTPQGVLNAAQNLRRLVKASTPGGQVLLRWKKPLALTSPSNVKAWQVFSAATNSFATASLIGEVTKTTFLDSSPGAPGSVIYYWVAGINSAGQGNPGTALVVTV